VLAFLLAPSKPAAFGPNLTISTRDGVQLMITVIRCPRTGRGCSDAICRDRSWCRKMLERGLSRGGLPLKRKFRPRCCARVALLDCEHSAITKATEAAGLPKATVSALNAGQT